MIRTADGHARKENPQITEEMETNMARFKILLNRGEQMASLKDHPGWLAIQSILKEKLDLSERKLNEFEKNDHRVNDLLMQERKNFKFFHSIVDDFEATIPKFQQAIENLEKQINERRRKTASV